MLVQSKPASPHQLAADVSEKAAALPYIDLQIAQLSCIVCSITAVVLLSPNFHVSLPCKVSLDKSSQY